MLVAQVAKYICRHCGKSFDEGRKLGGHVRQAHMTETRSKERGMKTISLPDEGEIASQILERWRNGEQPYDIIIALRVHPRFVREVIKEYDELLTEWKKFSEDSTSSPSPSNSGIRPSKKEVDIEW